MPDTETEQLAYRVDMDDENRFGERTTDTTEFHTLIEALNFAYVEGYKENHTVLNLHTVNLETGEIKVLYDRKALWTMSINREHDEQMMECFNPKAERAEYNYKVARNMA